MLSLTPSPVGRSGKCVNYGCLALPFLLVCLWGATTGCHSEYPRRSLELRDSAGIAIVDNRSGDQLGQKACSTSPSPVLSIGVVEGPQSYRLHRVFDAHKLSDGRIAIVNQGSHEIRLFDERGRYLSSIGRPGDGPGEFERVARVWELPGDSLLIWDRSLQSFSIFTFSGEYVRSFVINPPFLNPPDILTPRNDDGTILVDYHDYRTSAAGFGTHYTYHLRITRTGSIVDSLGAYPYRRYRSRGSARGSLGVIPIFDPVTQSAANNSRILVGRGVKREIEIRDRYGELFSLVRWAGPSRSVSREDVQRYRQELLSRSDDPGYKRDVRMLFETAPVNDSLPALADLRLDGTGNIWVREYARPGVQQTDRWVVFDQSGRFRCIAEIPKGLLLFQIGEDFLLGREGDPSEVEYVRLYELSVR